MLPDDWPKVQVGIRNGEIYAFSVGPRTPILYSTQQTPRGSVVVLGDRIISDYEMPEGHAQQTADWLNDRRKHGSW